MKQLFLSASGVFAVATTGAAFAATSTSATARLLKVTSPVSLGSSATLVARVVPARRCRITVHDKNGPVYTSGLYPKRPVHGRVSWTWKVGPTTALGRTQIKVNCGGAGSFRTSFRVRR